MTYSKKVAVFVAVCSLVLAQFATGAFAAGEETVTTTATVEQVAPADVAKKPADQDVTKPAPAKPTVTEAVYEEEKPVTVDPAERKAAVEAKVAEIKAAARAKAAAERQNGVKGNYLVYVNGERLNLTPIARSGRTLVPFRRLAEFLGAEVSWEPNTRTVTMVKGENTVSLVIGASTATVNGKEVALQVPSEIVESSTFVPLRFIAEALGADVDYDPATGAITVIDGEAVTPAPATETPSTETPATTTPSTETPATQTPSTETPATQTPSTSTSGN